MNKTDRVVPSPDEGEHGPRSRQGRDARPDAPDGETAEFLSMVSRELRTPLTLMLGPVEQLRRGAATPLPPGSPDALEVIHRNALRMLRLVNAMRDFARFRASEAGTFAPTDLAELMENLASNFRSVVEQAGLRFVVQCAPLPQPVYVDRAMWEQIALQLIVNAFEHTFEGEIGVTVRTRGARAELVVRDTGVGIPAEHLPHVFERFYRVPHDKRRTGEGTGNGLALVRELVGRHCGTVQIDSVTGMGTLVTVAIPYGSAHLPAERIVPDHTPRYRAPMADGPPSFVRDTLRWLPMPDTVTDSVIDTATDTQPSAEKPVAPVLPSRQVRDEAHRERILIADDNADMRQFLVGLLSARYDVEAVADGVAALAAIRECPPDLVLSDVMMPKLDGMELLRTLRADPQTRAISIVLLSARAEGESRAEGLDVGADDYLEKPFTTRELVARVNASLRLARMRREVIEHEQRALVAEAANSAKTQFLTAMSHELRTPLNAIAGYVDLLDMELEGPVTPQQRHALGRIRRSEQHLLALITDVLDFSQMEAGRMRYEMREVSVHEVLQRLSELIEPQASARNITYVHTPCSDDTPMVRTDPDRLTQIVLNLLTNAVKFTEPGGRVTMSCSVSHVGEPSEAGWNRVHIAVADTGCGIPAEEHASIFEPFVQLDRHLVRESQQGVGLGLAISRDWVRRLCGEITLESVEGEGSTFTVTLPRNADGGGYD